MTTSHSNSASQPARHPRAHALSPLRLPPDEPAPPSKRDLTSWWKQFKRNTKKEETGPSHTGIFGVPLNVSIKYANVAISLTGDDGKSFVYGYVPIVVAKCGVFLKDKATDVEGIFRLNGSAKRIKDLQEIFNSPDRYGKGLDWTGYTVHDAANILRRYLNQLPEPIVPLDFYERFRAPLRQYSQHKEKEKEGSEQEEKTDFDHDAAVLGYQQLIKELPPLNRQLLLYILDLLTVFASKSDLNRMTATNLAAIFQPGLLSHPSHDMSPQDYRQSQDVLVFLIENQDNFLFGMTGTAADEQTIKDVQNENYPASRKSGLARAASNASGGADSRRRYDMHRNFSTSSRHSKNSGGTVTAPGTPQSIGGASLGVHRSNTVPSKRPIAFSPSGFGRGAGASPPPTAGLSPSNLSIQRSRPSTRGQSPAPERIPEAPIVNSEAPIPAAPPATESATAPLPEPENPDTNLKPVATPNKDRKLSTLFGWSSPPETGRQPNRLKKKRRIPGSASESAQSSTQSLNGSAEERAPSLLRGISDLSLDQSHMSTPKAPATNTMAPPPNAGANQQGSTSRSTSQGKSENHLKVDQSRTPSPSSNYVTDQSDADPTDDTAQTERQEKRRSWRFHRSSRRTADQPSVSISPPVPIGSQPVAGFSSSSLGSSIVPQQSSVSSEQQANKEVADTGNTSSLTVGSQESGSKTAGHSDHTENSKDSGEERKGLFGKFKAKVAHVKEGVREREAERERTMSPHSDSERNSSSTSISFLAKDGKSSRGPSIDAAREKRGPVANESRAPPAEVPSSPPPTTQATPQPPIVPDDTPPATDTKTTTSAEGITVLPKVEEEPSNPPEESVAPTASLEQPKESISEPSAAAPAAS